MSLRNTGSLHYFHGLGDFQMSFEHPGNVFDRIQPTADRPAVPAIEEAFGLWS
jgi:hypothetical protein